MFYKKGNFAYQLTNGMRVLSQYRISPRGLTTIAVYAVDPKNYPIKGIEPITKDGIKEMLKGAKKVTRVKTIADFLDK